MNLIEAILLAIIEGITEYLPVSSTGHMIIASSFMQIANDDFTKLFTIVIQLGAILAVVVLYWKRFFQTLDFYFKLLVAFIPAVVLGLLLNDVIDELLESPLVVAITLVLGGVILIKVDEWFKSNEVVDENNPDKNTKISYSTALKIGLGTSYKINKTFELIAGFDWQYRVWQDIDVIDINPPTIYAYTIEQEDISKNLYLGVNIYF